MNDELPMIKDDEEGLFDYVYIKLKGFPIYTSEAQLEKFINSIKEGSEGVNKEISFPEPIAFNLIRSEKDLTAHAILKFNWCIINSTETELETEEEREEKSDNNLTKVLEACHRLKLVKLNFTFIFPNNSIIEPILICLNTPIYLNEPFKLPILNENQPINLVPFSFLIHSKNKNKKFNKNYNFHHSLKFFNNNSSSNNNKNNNINIASGSSSSIGSKNNFDSLLDLPRDYSNDDNLKNNLDFVKNQHEKIKEKKQTYLAAEKLLRIRNMPYADRLNQQ